MDSTNLWGSQWGDQGSPSSPTWQNWANAIDPTQARFTPWTQWAQGQSYAYGQATRSGSFDPTPRGDPYAPIDMILSPTTLSNADIDAYLQRTNPAFFGDFYGGPGTGTNAGQVTSGVAGWANVDRWDQQITAAARKVAEDTGIYVPPNLVKAVMMLESGGDPNAMSLPNNPSGGDNALGLMQIVPSVWGNNQWGLSLDDPAQNIELGIRILAQNYQAGDPGGSGPSWEWAAKRYLGLGGADAYGTTADPYWQQVKQYWDQLGQVATGGVGGTQAPAGTLEWNAIWGGFDAPITQGFGYEDCVGDQVNTCFAKTSGLYGYGSSYSRDGQPMGHTGVDVGIVYGTPLYVPVGGTVVCGGTGFGNGTDPCTVYNSLDANGNITGGDHQGRFQLQLANGDMLIFGHMNEVVATPGATIAPGTFVGYSGGMNGDHVHVEYRKYWGPPGTVTSTGYEEIDPRQALVGNFSGTFGQTPAGQRFVPASASGNWQSFMQAAASGQPITGRFTGGGGFHDWLKDTMFGVTPAATQGGPPVGWTWDYGQNGPTTGQPPVG